MGEFMKHIQFWQRWLLAITILIIIFGILLIIFNESALFNWLFNDRVEAIFWPDISPTTGMIQFQRWLYGVLGAVMVGWGITMAFILAVPFRRGERWAWYSITVSIGSWYILDTAVSIYYQATFNAVFNTLILLLFLPPLLSTWKRFHHALNEQSAPGNPQPAETSSQ